MQKPLQSATAVLDHLLEPASLLQLACIGGAVLLGWWLAGLLRPHFADSVPQKTLNGRAREAAWVGSPFALANTVKNSSEERTGLSKTRL